MSRMNDDDPDYHGVTKSVRLEGELASRVGILVKATGATAAGLLTPIVEPWLDQEFTGSTTELAMLVAHGPPAESELKSESLSASSQRRTSRNAKKPKEKKSATVRFPSWVLWRLCILSAIRQEAIIDLIHPVIKPQIDAQFAAYIAAENRKIEKDGPGSSSGRTDG